MLNQKNAVQETRNRRYPKKREEPVRFQRLGGSNEKKIRRDLRETESWGRQGKGQGASGVAIRTDDKNGKQDRHQ